MSVSTYWKALVAGIVAGAGALSTAAADDVITSGEVWLVVSAVVGGLVLTWAVPNKPVTKEED